MFYLQVIGNLGADAEVRVKDGRTFVTFRVAANKTYTKDDGTKVEESSWVSCVLSGDGGNLLQYLKKGRPVFVAGDASLRVFSSKAARAMVAGADISVRTIELLPERKGGHLPQLLHDSNGTLVETLPALVAHPDVPVRTLLWDSGNVQYVVDDNHFVVPYENPANNG